MMAFIERYRFLISVTLLIIFYAVGITAIVENPNSFVVKLTPLNLLLSVFLLFWNHPRWNKELSIFIIIAFGVGMGVEWLGVHTSFPFGEYSYGENLGLKIAGVPLVIGVNWVMLAYATGVMVHRFKMDKITSSLLTAGVMMGLDVLIEPVAPVLDFWSFADGTAPVENFLGWFGAAFIIQLFFAYLNFPKTNKLALPLLWVQIVFFTILNFTIV